jgi:hypothetical protein
VKRLYVRCGGCAGCAGKPGGPPGGILIDLCRGTFMHAADTNEAFAGLQLLLRIDGAIGHGGIIIPGERKRCTSREPGCLLPALHGGLCLLDVDIG